MENFNIRLIDGEIIESNEDTHFFIVRNDHEIGGACHDLENFLNYSKGADNIAVTKEFGNEKTTKIVIPKKNIVEYLIK